MLKSNQKFLKFVNESISNKQLNKKYVLNNVTINGKNKKVVINSADLRHVFNSHGNKLRETSRKQHPVSKKDIYKIKK